MSVQTLTTIRRARARVNRRRNGAAQVLTEMQHGATLLKTFTRAGPVWSLSTGAPVSAEVAKLVTANVSVIDCGDSLFPRAAGAGQTFRWLET
jgi:hypothetical protein